MCARQAARLGSQKPPTNTERDLWVPLSTITTITRVNRSSFSQPTFYPKTQKSLQSFVVLGDATSIHSEIEGNKVNRSLFRMPEQLLHTLAEANDTWVYDSFPEKPGTLIGISVKNRAEDPISRSREPGNSPISCHFGNCCFFHCMLNWLGIRTKVGIACSWADVRLICAAVYRQCWCG